MYPAMADVPDAGYATYLKFTKTNYREQKVKRFRMIDFK